MDEEELYDNIQEIKTAFVITFLIAIYCFSMDMEFFSAHIEWKVICASVGFLVVSAVAVNLLFQLFRLKKAYKKIPKDSE